MSKIKIKTIFQCQQCHAETPKYLGRCPECGEWNSLLERKVEIQKSASVQTVDSRELFGGTAESAVPQLLKDVCLTDELIRYSSGFPELDRVLGGGFIPGAYILIGGDPGIGKSTLMLQVSQVLGQQGKTVLYVAGEESPHQIKMRAERLGLDGHRILVYPETNIHKIQHEIKTSRPDMVIIDSIQAIYDPDLSGTPGNVGQIKECAGQLMVTAKALNTTIILIGHVTKEGAVSGPKLLEHTVDAVLYFEGEKFRNLRIIRAVKNRFGNTNEIGVFEITEAGLLEVSNPSELFLSENSYQNLPGSAIVATMEGNRPLLIEIQALVGFTTYASPRRVANGFDISRLHQIVAVLERRLGLDFSKQDIYVNVVGGMRIQEPAADLGIALALVTSHYQTSLKPGTVVAGEIGLTGEVRPISHFEGRVVESEKLGFKRIVLPQVRHPKASGTPHHIEQVEIHSLMEALKHCLDQKPVMHQDRRQSQVEGDTFDADIDR